MGLFESHEEKKFDVRVIDRDRLFGRPNPKTQEEHLKTLPDCESMAAVSNLDELTARDNPVHIARNLPTSDLPVRRNLEDIEFDADESNRAFEQ